ncbi:hypothetical protein BDZ89DRAFT_1059201, partial [Hymenopellis radicata]
MCKALLEMVSCTLLVDGRYLASIGVNGQVSSAYFTGANVMARSAASKSLKRG